MAKIDFKKIDTYRKSFDGILQVKKHVSSEDDLPVTGAQNGDIYTVGDSNALYIFNAGEWRTLGSAGVTSATVTVDESTGTPSASASVENGVLSISFSGLKGKQGIQGNTGSSVDYPYELVNNLKTDDATKGLSAAQGVVLDGKISQLGSKIEAFHAGIVAEDGLFFVDEYMNIGAQLTQAGFAALNSLTFIDA